MKFNVIPSVSSGYIIAVTFVHELKVYHKWLTHVKQPKNIYLLEKIKKTTKTTDSMKHRQKVVLLMELNA